jgi:predicted transcriptional regulator
MATTLKLSEELQARILAQAQAEGKTPHAYIIEALERQEKRAERLRECLAAGDTEDTEKYIVVPPEEKKAPRSRPIKRATKKP